MGCVELGMTKTATENIGLRAARIRKRLKTSVRFYALEGSVCVMIEADSEADARYLCQDVKLDFLGLCGK